MKRETDLCFKQHQWLSIILPSPPPQKKPCHPYRRHLYNHFTLLDVFVTTAGVPVVIFSAWAVVGPGGRSVVLDISTVKGGKVADLFNGVFWGIGPKKYIYRKLSLKHPLNSFCSLQYQKAGHLHEVVLFLLPESISHLPSVILKWRETDLCFKQHQGLSIIPPSPPPKKSSHRYRRHLYNHFTLLDVFVTTAGVPVVIFSAWAVVGPGGRSVVLNISTVGGGKVADWFNGVFWGIGPKKYIYWKLSLKHPLNSFCSLQYQ